MTYEEIQSLIKNKKFDQLLIGYLQADIPESMLHTLLKEFHKEIKRLDSLCQMAIPNGPYCYEGIGHDADGVRRIKCCPFWDSDPSKGEQEFGICHYLEMNDWEEWQAENGHIPLLWDQCKECGINDNPDDDGYEDDIEGDQNE